MSFIQFIHAIMANDPDNNFTLYDAEQCYKIYCKTFPYVKQPSE